MEDLKAIEKTALQRTGSVANEHELQTLRSEFLGKKGAFASASRGLRDLSAAERPAAGKLINAIRASVESAMDARAAEFARAELDRKLEAGRYDITLPGRRQTSGAPHPLRLVEEDIIRSLRPLGFSVARGPLIEHDWFNFGALNFPPDHPARDMQDTFFVGPDVMLRTHTSNVQIRTMLQQPPPVRVLAPGMVFRNDEVDATHAAVFHQIEGLWVDERVSFADLKGVLKRLATHLFGSDTQVRFRPSFFPFTEPSAEVDVSCIVCDGHESACRVCRGSGWLEVLGAGMVDPAVLDAVGYDAAKLQGFAFGVGVERVAMLRWGIDDIRLFLDNDLRFLHQFARSVA